MFFLIKGLLLLIPYLLVKKGFYLRHRQKILVTFVACIPLYSIFHIAISVLLMLITLYIVVRSILGLTGRVVFSKLQDF